MSRDSFRLLPSGPLSSSARASSARRQSCHQAYHISTLRRHPELRILSSKQQSSPRPHQLPMVPLMNLGCSRQRCSFLPVPHPWEQQNAVLSWSYWNKEGCPQSAPILFRIQVCQLEVFNKQQNLTVLRFWRNKHSGRYSCPRKVLWPGPPTEQLGEVGEEQALPSSFPPQTQYSLARAGARPTRTPCSAFWPAWCCCTGPFWDTGVRFGTPSTDGH